MVADPSSNKMVLFGGGTGVSDLNDTWAYNPAVNNWSELSPSGALPPARSSHAMTCDPVNGRLILFGGNGDEWTLFGDTWAYDLAANTWAELEPADPLPSARIWHTMIYDPGSGKVVMFGGMTGEVVGVMPNVPFGDESLNDTWTYDPVANTWTELEPGGAVPAARGFQAMVYDPSTQKIILFGGGTATALFNDTWAYDPAANTWTYLDPAGALPAARGSHAMAYDPTTRRIILFGGATLTDRFNDTWAYDPAANTWTELALSGSAPSTHASATMAYDPAAGRMIVFGGWDEADSSVNDTWALTP
ncbi:MAG: hypothetical protein JXA87_14860 [Thermoleophilia bacterium]|nr:hypothetical protein [Thermoleophilia bacterium]